MAAWPRDGRSKITSSSKKKKDASSRKNLRNYPNIEPGMIGAATLLEDDQGKMNWTFLTENEAKGKQRLKVGRTTSFFPATRALPEPIPQITIRRKAEEGANFLRTYIPDADVPSELIRAELTEDTTLARELEECDPYLGNILAVYQTESSASFLFPMGEVQQDLNISTLCNGKDGEIVFKPAVTPAHIFSTPIEQIVVSPRSQDAALAVRTFGGVELFRLQQHAKSHATVTPLGQVQGSDLSGTQIIDLHFLSSFWEAIMVDKRGEVHHCNIVDDAFEMRTLLDAPEDSQNTKLWRIGLGNNPDSCFRMSDKEVIRLDTRSEKPAKIFSLANSKNYLTSITVEDDENIVRLCSTEQLIWIDPRMPGRALLSYAHDRQYDRHLQTITYRLGNDDLTLLTTPRNSLVTVYDVSRSEELLRLHDNPYSFSLGPSMYPSHAGLVSLSKPAGLAFLSDEGALSFVNLLSEQKESPKITIQQSRSFKDLVENSAKLQPWLGSLGTNETSQVDLGKAYKMLYDNYFDDMDSEEEQKKNLIYDLIDAVPSFWQRKDAPIDTMLTTYDVIFRSGEEPKKFARADFLTGSMIDSKRGYRALQQGRLSAENIDAPWKFSIAETIKCIDKDIETDPEKVEEYVASLDRQEGVEDTWEDISRRQLAMDLALSSDIFSEHRIERRQVKDQELEAMAEALSLGEEPPPVEFHYFRPLEERDEDEEGGSRRVVVPPEIPMGVRLLLKEWDSRPPEEYEYRDPYGVSDPSDREPKDVKPSLSKDLFKEMTQTQTQRPPEILAAAVVPPVVSVMSRRLPMVGSQGDAQNEGSQATQTQEFMASTQIVPGPHGGRPSGKKKEKKKRVGGF